MNHPVQYPIILFHANILWYIYINVSAINICFQVDILFFVKHDALLYLFHCICQISMNHFPIHPPPLSKAKINWFFLSIVKFWHLNVKPNRLKILFSAHIIVILRNNTFSVIFMWARIMTYFRGYFHMRKGWWIACGAGRNVNI